MAIAKVWVSFCFPLQVVDLEVRTHFLFGTFPLWCSWYQSISASILEGMGPAKPGHCPASGTVHVWMQDEDCFWGTDKKLMLLGAKAEQGNTTTKNV